MSVIIKGMEMPTACMKDCPFQYFGDCYGGKIKRIMDVEDFEDKRHPRCPLGEVPIPHGRLIDANAIQNEMYHKSFETDDDRQKWDSGLWIRYNIFEESINNASTVIEGEE